MGRNKLEMHKEMTSYERVMTVLEGKIPDRVPVILQNRDWVAKQLNYNLDDIMHNAEKFVFSQYSCVKKYGYDSLNDLSGIHAEAEALGTKLKVQNGWFLIVDSYAVKDKEDIKRLRVFDPCKDGRLPMMLEIIRQLKSLGDVAVPVMCYVQAPLRCAAMIKGTGKVLKDMLKKPDELHELLEIATLCQIVYVEAMIKAGADIVFVSDPISSGDVISRGQWETFGYPYVFKLVKYINNTGAKTILHVCGNTQDRLDSFASLGVHALSIEEKVDLSYARKVVGDNVCLMGNVSPEHLVSRNRVEIKEASSKCIDDAGQSGRFILSSGCLMSPDTPDENVQAMVEAAWERKY
jgi:uroporphyrinogen decarboxylase